jgi:protein associated with RNAse G/E
MVLDVFVHPDGRAQVLDEDEFEEKAQAIYSVEDAARAKDAVTHLLEMVNRRVHPFDGTERPEQEG